MSEKRYVAIKGLPGSEERKEYNRIAQRKYRQKNIMACRKRERIKAKRVGTKYQDKEKNHARTCLRNAVALGKIQKPNKCEECGKSQERLNGHHDDYSKPLLVRWLCTKCHGKHHRKADAILTLLQGGEENAK